MSDNSNVLQKRLYAKFEKAPILVLQELKDVFTQPKSENYKTLLMQIADFNELKREKVLGIETPEHDTKIKKIRSTTFDLIGEIDEEQAKIYFDKNSDLNDFLILCRDERRISDMRKLFPKETYPNTVIIPEEDLDEYDATQYSLVIYDNFPLSPNSSEIPPGLEDILLVTKEKEVYVLFHSPDYVVELHEDYPDRVYFSNSKFSIHSRINEMLLFLKRSSEV